MKMFQLPLICALFGLLTACMTDAHHTTQNAQKIVNAINTKYPADKNTLVFIDAPEGYIARYLNNAAVENNVDTGKVTAIFSSLALKTSTVIVTGEDEKLTAATLAKALKLGMGKDNIAGAKAVVVGAKETQKVLSDLANASGVTLEFIDNPI